MFHNPSLEAAEKEFKAQFDKLLAEGSPRKSSPRKGERYSPYMARSPSPGTKGVTDIEMSEFYEVMGEFYAKDKDIHRHQSPTKRLIQQKNAAWGHKQQFRDKVRPT